MVEVNGSLVPPLGQDPVGDPRNIIFEGVKLPEGTDPEFRLDGDWKSSKHGPKGAELGKMKRSPAWPGGYISVAYPDDEKDPKKPKKKKKHCKATIYFHLTLVTPKECDDTSIDATMRRLEEAAKKLSGKCRCPEPPAGKVHDKNEGREVKVVLVWHPKAGKGVAKVVLDCGDDPPSHGYADSNKGFLSFKGNFAKAHGRDVGANASLAAHELGHLLFGTGPQKPKNTDKEGHSKDPNDLMRDTMAEGKGTGGPMTKDDKATQKELCMLAEKAGLKQGDCCTYKDKPKDNVPLPSEVPGLTQL